MAAKKANKKESEGNVLMFYAVQYSASSIFKTKVSPKRIKFLSAFKSQVQYELESGNGVKLIATKDGGKAISDDQKKAFLDKVNSLLSIETKVSSSKCNNNDIIVPNGIGKKSDLYNVQINDVSGVSHIPITSNTLDDLVNFKMIKCNYKENKSLLDITISFESKQNNKNKEEQKNKSKNKKKNNNQKSKSVNSRRTAIKYFDDQKVDEKDDRTIFSKEIIELVLNDVNVDNIDKDKLERLLGKVHDVMNQFQSISYTKGYKACLNNK